MNFTTLIVKSSNPDLNGKWNEEDILNEMYELGISAVRSYTWFTYLIDKIFDDYALPVDIENIILNDNVSEITFKLDNDRVQVIKK